MRFRYYYERKISRKRRNDEYEIYDSQLGASHPIAHIQTSTYQLDKILKALNASEENRAK